MVTNVSPTTSRSVHSLPMYVRADSLDEEVRVTVDAAVELANLIAGESHPDVAALERPEQIRAVLVAHDFQRGRGAGTVELAALADRLLPIARLVRSLPDIGLADAVGALNGQLEAAAIAPSLSAHDGFALHIHWTGPSTPFAHQVAVDVLMALAQTLCDHGVERFGRCAAGDCERVFYDTTKNRSRRFCTDPRCASRTHTAAHRARRDASE